MSGLLLIEVEIPGSPVGAARPRVTARGTFMPPRHREWESRASTLARRAYGGREAYRGPVAVDVEAQVRRGKNRTPRELGGTQTRAEQAVEDSGGIAWCATKPDLDNVVKLAIDALVKAGVLADDTQVVQLGSSKVWAPPLDGGRVMVRVWALA